MLTGGKKKSSGDDAAANGNDDVIAQRKASDLSGRETGGAGSAGGSGSHTVGFLWGYGLIGYPSDNPELRASGSWILLYFVLAGRDRLSSNDLNFFHGTANADRHTRRARTFAGEPLKGLLHDPVFKRMECDNGKSAFGFQNVYTVVQEVLEYFEFFVDGDP